MYVYTFVYTYAYDIHNPLRYHMDLYVCLCTNVFVYRMRIYMIYTYTRVLEYAALQVKLFLSSNPHVIPLSRRWNRSSARARPACSRNLMKRESCTSFFQAFVISDMVSNTKENSRMAAPSPSSDIPCVCSVQGCVLWFERFLGCSTLAPHDDPTTGSFARTKMCPRFSRTPCQGLWPLNLPTAAAAVTWPQSDNAVFEAIADPDSQTCCVCAVLFDYAWDERRGKISACFVLCAWIAWVWLCLD